MDNYPFRVLIDDSNYVNIAPGTHDLPALNFRQPSKVNRRKTRKGKSGRARVKTNWLDDVTSSCFSDSGSVSTVSSWGGSASTSSSASGSTMETESDDGVRSESSTQLDEHRDMSASECDSSEQSREAVPVRSNLRKSANKAMKRSKRARQQTDEFLLRTVVNEIESLNKRGFGSADYNKDSLEAGEAVLLNLKMQEARVVNRTRVAGFLKAVAVLITLVCKFAKVSSFDVSDFALDVKREIESGEFDQFIDILQPSMKNHVVSHPVVGIITKFFEIFSDSTGKKLQQQKAKAAQDEASSKRAQSHEATQALIQKIREKQSDSSNG